MSGTPINLNRARKDRARAEARQKADENSVRFGRTRAEREAEARKAEQARRTLDAHKREE